MDESRLWSMTVEKPWVSPKAPFLLWNVLLGNFWSHLQLLFISGSLYNPVFHRNNHATSVGSHISSTGLVPRLCHKLCFYTVGPKMTDVLQIMSFFLHHHGFLFFSSHHFDTILPCYKLTVFKALLNILWQTLTFQFLSITSGL